MEDIIKGIGGEYTGNYTGPHWSDGKYQESVEWGNANPQSELDYLSRQHDSAYARFKDAKHREAADKIYHDEAKKLTGKFPQLAGNLVLYGNYAGRQSEKLFNNAKTGAKLGGPLGALAGAVYTAGGNIVDSMARINGTYLKKEIADIQKYYESDPRRVVLKDRALNASSTAKTGVDPGRVAPKDTSSKAKIELPSISTPQPKPTTRNQDLIEKQARRFEKFANLEKEAKQSEYKNTQLPFYVPQYIKRRYSKRIKKNKKNKIHITN